MPGVLAYHLILTNYGFWLPNDPRGSWSTFVRAFELYRVAGPATTITTTRSVAHASHNTNARRAAKAALTRRPVIWTGRQARAVAQGFADYATKNHRPIHALAVMPDHAHLVVGRTDLPIEQIANQLKSRATTFLNQQKLHPFADNPFSGRTEGAPSPPPSPPPKQSQPNTPATPRDAARHPLNAQSRRLNSGGTSGGGGRLPIPWARHHWAVYLDTPAAIHRAIRYVNDNPIHAGHKPQRYDWLTPYPV
jgi:hypothetical protein